MKKVILSALTLALFIGNISAETNTNNTPLSIKQNGVPLIFDFDEPIEETKPDEYLIPFATLKSYPGQVYSYVKSNFTGWILTDIDADGSKIALELEKGDHEAEIKFSRSGKLIKVEFDD